MSGKKDSERVSPPVLRERPPRAAPPEKVRKPKKGKVVEAKEGANPFVQRPRVVRSPPVALTPPTSTIVDESGSTGRKATESTALSLEGDQDETDTIMEDVLAKLTDVMAAQVESQREMTMQNGKFQRSLAEVLRSHDDQLAAQMTQHGEFQRTMTEVIAGQARSQRMLEEQLRLMREELTVLRTQGRGQKGKGLSTIPSYDGTTDADGHMEYYEAVAHTESWTDDEKKTRFHNFAACNSNRGMDIGFNGDTRVFAITKLQHT